MVGFLVECSFCMAFDVTELGLMKVGGPFSNKQRFLGTFSFIFTFICDHFEETQ